MMIVVSGPPDFTRSNFVNVVPHRQNFCALMVELQKAANDSPMEKVQT